jgi:hypothetical protein
VEFAVSSNVISVTSLPLSYVVGRMVGCLFA